MTSRIAPAISRFSTAGIGMTVMRMCNGCANPKTQLGGGIRFVLGGRRWVCAACKERIDAAKNK